MTLETIALEIETSPPPSCCRAGGDGGVFASYSALLASERECSVRGRSEHRAACGSSSLTGFRIQLKVCLLWACSARHAPALSCMHLWWPHLAQILARGNGLRTATVLRCLCFQQRAQGTCLSLQQCCRSVDNTKWPHYRGWSQTGGYQKPKCLWEWVSVTSFASHSGISSALPCNSFNVWVQDLKGLVNVRRVLELYFKLTSGLVFFFFLLVKDQMQRPVRAAGGFTLISIRTGLGFWWATVCLCYM